jgi:tRNA pseudouridine32 synthase/23S rRNA pseudouridine746 synthase
MSVIVDTFIAPPCAATIEILFEDEHLLLINKPSGLLSLSGKNPQNLDSVHHRLVQDYPGCALVHRLDFGTSASWWWPETRPSTPCSAASSASAR